VKPFIEACMHPQLLCLLLVVELSIPLLSQEKTIQAATPGPARLDQLVEANIIGVHAYQVLLARKEKNMDPACWPASTPSDAELEALVAHQTSLLRAPAAARAWALGAPSTFDPAKDLQPLLSAPLAMPANLPVNLFATYLQGKAPNFRREEIRSIANLYQTVLEVERDGDRLQDLYGFSIALGLPVYIGQLGLPGTDEDLLATGKVLEGHACASPVGLGAAEWQIAGRKIWNWGEKNLHIRDAKVLADELLAEPDVRSLAPRMKALPAQRIAVIGHSFTMDLHWASPSAFVPIVTAMFAVANPAVEFRQFQAGGLTSSRAMKNFYQDALAWKPDTVLLVLINRTDQDLADLRALGQGFKAAGARVVMFDDVHDPDSGDPEMRQKEGTAAREAGMEVAVVGPTLAASPDRSRFSCLDHIHMTEPYHRLMAKEWLRVILKEARTDAAK
jgi:hypothetical protein